MTRYELYSQLKKSGYPQGGGGQWMQDPDSNDKVYIPTYQELLMHYIATPEGWERLVDTLTNLWIDNKIGK